MQYSALAGGGPAVAPRRTRTDDMNSIIALIVAGTVFRTAGTWALTRLVTIVVVVYAILLDFTPLAYALKPAALSVWVATFVLWVINVIVARRAA
jgi:hypothetical protein